jgi:hypothetical protein
LGLVRSAGRSDRLVVDSSVSGVTDNTQLPNRSSNPTLNDVRSCLPLCLPWSWTCPRHTAAY